MIVHLRLAHKEEMGNIFINVMAGNPFIITKHVNEQSFVNSYLTEMASEKSSAVTATLMRILYSKRKEKRAKYCETGVFDYIHYWLN
jgi:hypothetical protein